MENIEGFKKFIYKGSSYTPRVVVRKCGQIGFNAGALHKYDLDLFEYVMLFISVDKGNRIAVQFTNNEKLSGLIRIQKRKGSFAFSARSFLGLYDIDWSKTINYDFTWNDAQKIAFFTPNKKVGTTHVKPTKAGALDI